jgi:hypothetical protein
MWYACVPAESISKKSESSCFDTIDRKEPSAVGERQILPIQTNKTLVFINTH